MFKNIKIGTKISLGFAVITILLVVLVSTTIVQVNKSSDITKRVIDLRVPTTMSSIEMINGMNHSLAALRGWIILGKDKFKDKTILYIEDDLDIANNFNQIFEILFKQSTLAYNGIEALEYYKTSKFDTILTDISMPKMNGIELARKIKELNPSQKMIAMSGDKDKDIDGHEIFDYWYLKPANPEEIIKLIETVLNSVSSHQM